MRALRSFPREFEGKKDMNERAQVPLEDLLIRYGVFMHRRFYDREKRRFLVALAKEFEEYGYQTQIKMHKHGAFKIRNLYVGNMERAKTIFTTYYDTPTVSMSSSYKLLDKKPNQPLTNAIPLAVIMIIGVVFIQYVGLPNWSTNWWSTASLLSVLVALILFGLLIHFRRGMGARRNVVRNTSSILAMIEAARNLDPDLTKSAFVFTDYGCVNHFGESLVAQEARDVDQSKNYVMLDGVGAIGQAQLLVSANMENRAKRVAAKVFNNTYSLINLDKKDVKQRKLHKNVMVLSSGQQDSNKEVIVSKKVSDEQSKTMMENIRQASEFILTVTNEN